MVHFDGGATSNGGASYSYDGDGRRVTKVVGGSLVTTVFVYDIMGQLVAEYSTSGSENAGTSYITSDTLGSPRVITSATQQIKGRHDYLPFGEEILQNTGDRIPQHNYAGDNLRKKFTQKERDIETGLDYFLARYYASTQGRFTSPDPLSQPAASHPRIPQSWNLYSYVLNNPLKLIDPDGLMWVYHYLNKEQTQIGIAWIKGNNISKALAAKGYKALNFGGQSSTDVTLTDGSVVRLNVNSDEPKSLRGPQESGSDGGFVNAGLVRELSRQTAPIPAATIWFGGASIVGGYTLGAAVGITVANAAAYAILAEHQLAQQSENDAQMMGTVTQYDQTKPIRGVFETYTPTSRNQSL